MGSLVPECQSVCACLPVIGGMGWDGMASDEWGWRRGWRDGDVGMEAMCSRMYQLLQHVTCWVAVIGWLAAHWQSVVCKSVEHYGGRLAGERQSSKGKNRRIILKYLLSVLVSCLFKIN